MALLIRISLNGLQAVLLYETLNIEQEPELEPYHTSKGDSKY